MPYAGLHGSALAGCRGVISFCIAFCTKQQVEFDPFVWVAVPVVSAWLAEVVTAVLRRELTKLPAICDAVGLFMSFLALRFCNLLRYFLVLCFLMLAFFTQDLRANAVGFSGGGISIGSLMLDTLDSLKCCVSLTSIGDMLMP